MFTRRATLRNLILSAGGVALSSRGWTAPAPAPAITPAGPFELPPLGFAYDALEPYIDAETMKLHYEMHHAAYVAKLNTTIASEPALGKKLIADLLENLGSVPESLRAAVRNQGGGHFNHSYFWRILKKAENGKPLGELATDIDRTFGSFTKFQDAFALSALKIFGSGWAWLVLRNKKLAIENTANQDTPITTGGAVLLGIDVWEHAYYLKYRNRRADYVKAFQNVINWDFISLKYTKLVRGQ